MKIVDKKFGDAGLDSADVVNKGSTGQMLEKAIGLPLSNKMMDLSDGELKSTKFLSGKPAESGFVTQLPHILNDIANAISYIETNLAMKLRQVIHVPVHKDSQNPLDWYIGLPKIVSKETHPEIHLKIAQDFEFIAAYIRSVFVEKDASLHTYTGPNGVLQIRTKDSKPYKPISWNGDEISNKSFAFYFTRNYIIEIFKT
jgi:DNA mismatch repair protein MutH